MTRIANLPFPPDFVFGPRIVDRCMAPFAETLTKSKPPGRYIYPVFGRFDATRGNRSWRLSGRGSWPRCSPGPTIGLVGFWTMMIFLGVLTIGFIYEWKKGALEWD